MVSKDVQEFLLSMEGEKKKQKSHHTVKTVRHSNSIQDLYLEMKRIEKHGDFDIRGNRCVSVIMAAYYDTYHRLTPSEKESFENWKKENNYV